MFAQLMGPKRMSHPLSFSEPVALILIDLQKAIDHPSWGQRNNPQAERNVLALLARWREARQPLVHVRHVSDEPQSTFRPNQSGVDFRDGTGPRDDEVVITKHRPCALLGTGLEAWLRERAIEQIVIVGVITNNSVEATARVALDLGFAATVVSDATFTFGRHDFSGRWRDADEVHAMSLANLSGQYATVWSTAQLLAACLEGAP
jgi:nicotinamidase-related amidase